MQTRSKLKKSVALQKTKGFSLLELMIAIALVGILISLAVPSFEAISNTNKLSGSSNEVLTSLQMARIEAVRRGVRTVVCKSTNPDSGASATCSTAAGNWTGWIAFVDDGGGTPANARNGSRDAGEIVIRTGTVTTPVLLVPSAAISGASQRLTFRPDGLARTAANGLLAAQLRVCIATTRPAQNSRGVALASGSRTTILKATDATCATTTN